MAEHNADSLDELDQLEQRLADSLDATPALNHLPAPRQLKRARREVRRRPVGPPQPKQGYHHGDLARALIDGAITLINEQGPRGWSLRAVAKLAGVSPAAPYRHFADKEALLAAVAEEGFLMLQEFMDEDIPEGLSPRPRLERLGLAYVRFAQRHPAHFRVMFGPDIENKPAYTGLYEASQQTFTRILENFEALCTQGELAGQDPEVLTLAFWAQIHGLTSLILDRQVAVDTLGDGTIPGLAHTLMTLLLNGMAQPQ